MENRIKTADKISLEKIVAFEKELLALPQVDIECRHFFCNGLYAREIKIPQGVILTGKRHKEEHLNFLMKGKMVVITDDGVEEIESPAIIKSSIGIKRIGLALEDSIWVTAHPNPDNLENIDELELRYIDGSDILKIDLEVKKCLG